MSDEELYLKFIAGNQEYCDILFNKYKNELLKFAYLFVKDIQFAEDIVQETFLYIVQNPNKYNNKYSVKSFLYMVCKGKACNFRRDMKKRKMIESDSLEDYLDFSDFKDTESVVIEREDRRNILKGMNLLNYQYRTAIYLVDFRGLSYKDAGIILGKSENQFKILIHRARAKLQNMILNDFTKESKKNHKKYDETEYWKNNNKEKVKRICKTGLMFVTIFIACTTTILCVNPDIAEIIRRKVEYILSEPINKKLENGPLKDELISKANEYAKIILGEEIEFNKVIEVNNYREKNKIWSVKKDDDIIIDISNNGELKGCFDYRNEVNNNVKYKNVEELEQNVEILCGKLNLIEKDLLSFETTDEEINLCYIAIGNYSDKYKIINLKYNKPNGNIYSVAVTDVFADNQEINITREDALKIAEDKLGADCEIKSIKISIEKFYEKEQTEKKEFLNKTIEDVKNKKRVYYENKSKFCWSISYIDKNKKAKTFYIDTKTGEELKIIE